MECLPILQFSLDLLLRSTSCKIHCSTVVYTSTRCLATVSCIICTALRDCIVPSIDACNVGPPPFEPNGRCTAHGPFFARLQYIHISHWHTFSTIYVGLAQDCPYFIALHNLITEHISMRHWITDSGLGMAASVVCIHTNDNYKLNGMPVDEPLARSDECVN